MVFLGILLTSLGGTAGCVIASRVSVECEVWSLTMLIDLAHGRSRDNGVGDRSWGVRC